MPVASVCRIGFSQNVPSELKDIIADDKNFSVIASNVITVEKRVKELWFDVIPTSEKLLEGRGCGLAVRSCIASVRPLESAGKPHQVDGVPIHPINFSLLLPTLCWCAAATAVVNHVTLTLHDIRTRLRRGQAGWERTIALKDSKAPNPFTALLQLPPDQLHQDVLSYITQPVAGMSSGRVSVKDPKQVAQMHFRLNSRHFALLSSDCMSCIYDVEGANNAEVGSGNDSGVSTTSSAAVASQAKKIAVACLKDVINVGHPKFGHYIPSCTPLLVSTAQCAMYDVPSYSSLLFHKHNQAVVNRVRWMHYDRLIKMLSVVVGQPQADQLLSEGVGKHGRRIKASYREFYVLGKTPPKSAESDEDDAENNAGNRDEATTTSRPPPVVTGAKRERAHNEHGIEEYVDVDEEGDSVSSPIGGGSGGGMVAQSIKDLPFDVKIDWSPLLATSITDAIYQASVDAATTNMRSPDEQTKHLLLASNGGAVGPQHVFDAKVSRKPLSCIGVVADIQRTLLESSNLLGITRFFSSPLYTVDPYAPLMVSGILEARHPMDDPLHPLAHYIAFSGTASPVSSSCGVKHSHRPSRIVDLNAAATRDFMKSSNKERFTELNQRLSIFTDLVKRKLEQFEGVLQCIGSAMRPAKTHSNSNTTTTTSTASGATTVSSAVGWKSVVVEALPFHPYAIPAYPTKRTLHLEAKNMSVDAAQEVLHWVQCNHFVATVLQSLMFHAEEWAIQLRIALREGQEIDALKTR